jgi:TonB family protein
MNHRFRISSARAGVLALAAAVVLAAPASAQEHRDPPISAVLDSAGLVADAAALPVALPRGAPPLFSIAFDSTGAVDTVRAMLHGLPDAYAAPVVAAIRARLRPQPAGKPLSTYVRVVTGRDARVDRPAIRERAPELANRNETARGLARAAWDHATRLRLYGGSTLTTVARFRVKADGTTDVESAFVQRSSGDEGLDREALQAVARMRFRPAAIEGEAVAVWVMIPISFKVPVVARRDP